MGPTRRTEVVTPLVVGLALVVILRLKTCMSRSRRILTVRAVRSRGDEVEELGWTISLVRISLDHKTMKAYSLPPPPSGGTT